LFAMGGWALGGDGRGWDGWVGWDGIDQSMNE